VTDRPENPDQPPSYGTPSAPDAPQDGSAPQYGPPYGPQYGPQYGQPPQGQPPQGQPPQGQPPYGQPAYGQPGPYQQPETPEQSSLRTQAIVSLVINVLVVVSTCFTALPSIGGAITAGIALGQVGSDPDNARRLVRWSWGLLIASVVIGILIIAFIIVIAVVGASSSSSDPTFHVGLG
jgi:hypothetical protein